MKNVKADETGTSQLSAVEAEAKLNKERAQYELAQENYNGLEEKLELEFKKELPNLLSEDEREELEIGDDVARQYEILSEKRQSYIGDRLEEEEIALEAFAKDLEQKEEALQSIRAEDAFREKYPDADFEAMSQFFQNEMSPNEIKIAREKAVEDDGDDHELFMENIMNAYKKKNATTEDEVDLPANLSDIPGETGDMDEDDETDEKDMAYLRAIGQA